MSRNTEQKFNYIFQFDAHHLLLEFTSTVFVERISFAFKKEIKSKSKEPTSYQGDVGTKVMTNVIVKVFSIFK